MNSLEGHSSGADGSVPALKVSRLIKTYPGSETPAVAGIDMEIPAGQLCGLLGPNGAGKSTVISMLSAIMAPSSGRIELFGKELAANRGKIKRLIGLVPQEIALFQELTGRENLDYFGRLYGLSGKTLRRRVEDCLALTGMSEGAGQLVRACSGGMKRRLNLAAGILHRPRILLLDEPTVGIDAQSRNLIMEKLRDLHREGMTMIYTTHYMEEVEKLCQRVMILDRGRVICSGGPAELVDGGESRDLEGLFLSLTGKNLRD